jgi:radical SAM superfamily enzyme YgiQ (UPF0313 family)
MPDIILSTLNAKYIHAAFGLRYLMANLGDLKPSAAIVEFDINQRPADIAEILLARNPKILGLGVYIWNVAPTTEVVAIIKRVRPDITIILGGPEVSYETAQQEIVKLADHVITGEADLKFAEVCKVLLDGRAGSPLPAERRARSDAPYLPKVIAAPLPDFSQLALPYDLYTDDDIAHRVIYVEASRGCPFTCEFCLSSLDIPVRAVDMEKILGEMQKLLDRGVKQFKFVDRTFNLNVNFSLAILEFFLARHRPGLFFHFEMIPDRLPEALREIIAKFPPGALQFEVGVQTLNEDVEKLISRRQNHERMRENFHFLREQTGVHIHADLIVGLPGETLESFGAGFDKLIALGPQEIQVGILKRLRGTPIVRHDADWQMIYNAQPPYEILQNRLLDFATLQRLRRFAKYWDLVGNSGNFVESAALIWSPVGRAFSRAEAESDSRLAGTLAPPPAPSPFARFLQFSDWLYARLGRTDSIALARLAELLFEFLTREIQLAPRATAKTLWRDYQRGGRHDLPVFLREHLPAEETAVRPRPQPSSLPKRQARHLV